MRVYIAIIMCKLTRFLLRTIGRGGTNLPGKIAVSICPNLLEHLASQVHCIVITGTNGKTTTSRIVEQGQKEASLDYFSNRSGANLLTGITAEFAINSSLSGKPRKKYAVIECDEAASKKVCLYINPEVVLVTNVFSDQLDRYGEISHTLESLKTGIKNSPNAIICLNADDSLSVSLAENIPNKIIYFGVETPVYKGEVSELSDAAHCQKCGSAYDYDYVTYAHLGGFHCPKCGYRRPNANVAVTEIISQTPDNTTVSMKIQESVKTITINLPGGYNIYNGVGAAAALSGLGINKDIIAASLENFECGFGRMEKLVLKDCDVRMILVKNTAGCNQVLNYLTSQDGDALFVICLNDKIADGTDVSWIWDVNFEKLLEMEDRLSGILISGIRRDEMALRLKYAGISQDDFEILPDYSQLIDKITSQNKPVYIMPTYTAMLELRDIISKTFGYKDFWE